MRWDPNKKPQVASGGNLFLLIGGWTHCFTILFSYWFSITTIKNPIMPNQKKTGSATPILFFLFGGVLVIGRRIKPYILAGFAGKNVSTCLRGSPDSSESHRISLLKNVEDIFQYFPFLFTYPRYIPNFPGYVPILVAVSTPRLAISCLIMSLLQHNMSLVLLDGSLIQWPFFMVMNHIPSGNLT